MKNIILVAILLISGICQNCGQPDNNSIERSITTELRTQPITYNVNIVATIGIEEAQTKEEEPYQISAIASVDCDKSGNIFILDNKSCCVRVFDQSGKFKRTMFRRGKGPTEIVNSYRIKINQFSNSLYIIDEHGYKIKRFSLDGQYLNKFHLPHQIYDPFNFLTTDTMIYINSCKYREESYDNFKILNLKSLKDTRGYLLYFETERDDTFNQWQRFVIKENTLWTITNDVMELKAVDLSTSKVIQKIPVPGRFKKNQMYIAPYQGNKIHALLAYNLAQPLLLNNDLFVLLTYQEYDFNKKPKWKVVNPISRNMCLLQLKDQIKLEKIANFEGFDSMSLQCTYKNRIIFSSYVPYPHLIIVEVSS